MSQLANLLNQAAVRDVTCALLKRFLEGPIGINEPSLKSEICATLLPALGELPGVTIDDLCDAFVSATGGVPNATANDCSNLFKKFFDCVCKLAGYTWRSESLPVGPSAPYEWLDPIEEDGRPDWQSSDGTLSVTLVGGLPAAGSGLQMFAQMRGECSRRFFDVFCGEATAAAASLLRCVRDLAEEAAYELLDRTLQEPAEITAEQFAERMPRVYRTILDISGGGHPFTVNAEGELELVPGEDPLPYDSRRFVVDGIAAFFAEISKKKDSLARRIKNALRLIIESHNQSHNSIGLALSVTAIEALVCRKSENLSQMFAENMAALLEPDPKYRLDAEGWSKRLYGLRSGVLHGSELDCSPEHVRHAQVAAGMVLRALLERRAAIRRVGGNDENPEEFLKELRSGKYVPGQLTHVSELPLKRLWRKDAPKRIE